jgi:hypothetical protein
MNDRLLTAKRYREYAEELRTIASEKQVPENKNAFLNLAEDYDRMAAALEAVHQARRIIENSTIEKRAGRG